ncbi:hypothetical protein Trydic_g8865 [Trypoxylus dichotomus]
MFPIGSRHGLLAYRQTPRLKFPEESAGIKDVARLGFKLTNTARSFDRATFLASSRLFPCKNDRPFDHPWFEGFNLENWFQQDNAACRTSNQPIKAVQELFYNEVIPRKGTVNYPPYLYQHQTTGTLSGQLVRSIYVKIELNTH